jgi:hypothetical protein
MRASFATDTVFSKIFFSLLFILLLLDAVVMPIFCETFSAMIHSEIAASFIKG